MSDSYQDLIAILSDDWKQRAATFNAFRAERRDAAMIRRAEAWKVMVEAAEERFAGMDRAAVLEVMAKKDFRRVYRIRKGELAERFNTRMTTLTTLHSILTDLITIGGEGETEAPLSETFTRFRDIRTAEKRVQFWRSSYHPRHPESATAGRDRGRRNG